MASDPDRRAADFGEISSRYDAAAYGEEHSQVYDQIYAGSFRTNDAVAFLAQTAAGGPLLDLGVGTGRLALPLVDAGVVVHGLESSTAMIGELRARPGGENVVAFQGDMVDFALPEHYQVIVCAVSTLFMLPDQEHQIRCLRCARRHLHPDGILIVEAFVPDPSRFQHNQRTELRRLDSRGAHVLLSRHQPTTQQIHNEHVLIENNSLQRHHVVLRYAWPAELDAMAQVAGLTLQNRFGGWLHEPYDETTTDHVSCYTSM